MRSRADARDVHVGLNLIFLVPGETGGMEVYARELVPRLLEAAPERMRFTAFLPREAMIAEGDWGQPPAAVTVPVHARQRVQWVIGEQILLPPLAMRMGVDLVHSFASTAPAWGRFRRVVTVHDLIYAHFPEAHRGIRAKGMSALVPLAARRSDRVIAISQSTKDDLLRLLHVPAEKVDVVPQGLGLTRCTPAQSAEQTRAKLDLDRRRVLLSLSAKRPHKNLLKLIEALSSIPSERRPALLLPGYPTWHEAQLRQRAQQLGIEGDLRFLSWVSGEELEALWAIADAFVYSSLYEGFGLPVLEAMARGVPVACSDASSLPEVAGEAALLFDPRSEAEIASAIERLLHEPQLAQELKQAGIARAAQFTWERTAQLTIASYMRALDGGAR